MQVSLKAETEMAMKLLEKDIHEKQDTIVSLRRQLEDIKSINLDMYRKLQVIRRIHNIYFTMYDAESSSVAACGVVASDRVLARNRYLPLFRCSL